jgi:hypothetical protein
MKARQILFTSCAVILLGSSIAQAGPCSMVANKDAGSGPTPGHTNQTVGTASSGGTSEHPPTSTMNRASGDVATSSQDAQKQSKHPVKTA